MLSCSRPLKNKYLKIFIKQKVFDNLIILRKQFKIYHDIWEQIIIIQMYKNSHFVKSEGYGRTSFFKCLTTTINCKPNQNALSQSFINVQMIKCCVAKICTIYLN